MNDIVLEKRFVAMSAEVSLKLAVNNLFDEEYESVLNRPMPGRNFEVFVEIRPMFRRQVIFKTNTKLLLNRIFSGSMEVRLCAEINPRETV